MINYHYYLALGQRGVARLARRHLPASAGHVPPGRPLREPLAAEPEEARQAPRRGPAPGAQEHGAPGVPQESELGRAGVSGPRRQVLGFCNGALKFGALCL